MAELVYAFDLKSNGEIRAGSIPAPSTNWVLRPFFVDIIIVWGRFILRLI